MDCWDDRVVGAGVGKANGQQQTAQVMAVLVWAFTKKET